MAPVSYSSTYKTYKAGTKKITTWLVNNARRCNADLSFLSNPKSSATTIHQVPARHLTALAKAIAASDEPKIHIPANIVTVTRTVISLRKQANDWFTKLARSKKDCTTEAANNGHRYFITALEGVLAILQPDDTSEASALSITSADLTNMFSALTVEDTVSSDGTIPAPATKSKQTQSQAPQYDVEEDDTDHVFAVFTFFNDIHDIREHLMQVWLDFRNGKLNLMSAAITTDTAIGIMRRSSQDLIESLPVEVNYPSLVMTMNSYIESIGGNVDDLGEFVCARACGLLASYADVLEPGSLPAMKYGHFGVYDPKGKDWFTQSPDQQHRDDLIVLLEFLPEVTKLSRAKVDLPAEDELTACLRIMMDKNEVDAIPMHGIFATQVFLDIHHVLREHASSAFDELKATGNRVIQTLDDYFRFSRSRSIANWPAQNDQVFVDVQKYAKDWTQKDVMQDLGVAMSRTFKQQNVRSKPFWMLKNNPILCGLMVLRMNIMLQDGGINLCTAWGSVIYPAHLYNAARHSAGLDAEWKDMDYLISLHTPQRIFVGAPPTEPSDYHKRFLLALGGSASNFARNRRPGGRGLIIESKKGPRGLKSTTPVKDIWRDHVLYNKPVALTTPNIVAMLSVACKAERTSSPALDLQAFTREMVVQRQYTPIQILQIVREGVAAEELHFLFDYFSFHQRGLKLLRTLQTHLHADLVKYFTEDYIEDESQLPYIVGYIFEVVRGSGRIAQELQLQQGQGGSRMLHMAAGVLESSLQDGENRYGGVMKMRALSSAVVHAYHAGTLDSTAFPAGVTRLEGPLGGD